VVEEALQQLEIEVNNNLASLGLTDWLVKFDVERENKSGGLTKGFVVFVHPSGHEHPMRFEAYSGGETQRLRLAGDLGLANLIMERAGLVSTIEFLDEPSEHLSQGGLLDLCETLYQRAIDNNKRIWLVDHHALEFGDFAGQLTAIMTDKGSSLMYTGAV
jgi:DNA repair exonuclease SbcCD ATPase subunit